MAHSIRLDQLLVGLVAEVVQDIIQPGAEVVYLFMDKVL
jgi:hypothetical protein